MEGVCEKLGMIQISTKNFVCLICMFRFVNKGEHKDISVDAIHKEI